MIKTISMVENVRTLACNILFLNKNNATNIENIARYVNIPNTQLPQKLKKFTISCNVPNVRLLTETTNVLPNIGKEKILINENVTIAISDSNIHKVWIL